MDEQVRQKLCEIVARNGRALFDNPRVCEALLMDFCGKSKQEVNLLMTALKGNLIPKLMGSGGDMPREMRIRQLAKTLEGYYFTESAARWGVESWALALGVVSPDELTVVPHAEPQNGGRNGSNGHSTGNGNGNGGGTRVEENQAAAGGAAAVETGGRERPLSFYLLCVAVGLLVVFSGVMTTLKIQADQRSEGLSSQLSRAQYDLQYERKQADEKLKAERAEKEAAEKAAQAKLLEAQKRLPKGSVETITHEHSMYNSSNEEGVQFKVKIKANNLHNTQCTFYAYFYTLGETPVYNSYGSHVYQYANFTPTSANHDHNFDVFMPYSTVPSKATDYKVKIVMKRAGEVIAESAYYKF